MALTREQMAQRVAHELPDREAWLVPTIVQLELEKWLRRHVPEPEADRIAAFSGTCVVAILDTPIAIDAARLCALHRLPTADAIVYATARAYGADLLTCDRHFDGLPGVRLLPKSPA